MQTRQSAIWRADPTVRVHWNDLQPIEVQIFDDMALVYFHAHWYWSDDNGDHRVEQRRLEILVDGAWTVVGGMIVPTAG